MTPAIWKVENPISVEQYKEVLVQISDKRKELLQKLYDIEPAIDTDEIADKLGYEGMGGANLQIGTLGKHFCNLLNIQPDLSSYNASVREGGFFIIIHRDNGDYWDMEPNLRVALEDLKIVEKTASDSLVLDTEISPNEKKWPEGSSIQRWVSRYERDPQALRSALKIHGNKMTRISLEKIVDAFIFHMPTLKMQEIKDYIFENRGNLFEGYKTRYSFDQTIQKIVETHCATKKGFNGKPVFESPERGYYQLTDPQYWIALWQIESIDDKILKVNPTNKTEDLEITTRTLREVNIINRNKNLVQSLKVLYDNTCQLCGTQLKIADNLFYSEVHHIRALGEPHNGPDTATNMIVVCPNCHVMLDFKAIAISKEKLNTREPHKVNTMYIDYHNNASMVRVEVCMQGSRT